MSEWSPEDMETIMGAVDRMRASVEWRKRYDPSRKAMAVRERWGRRPGSAAQWIDSRTSDPRHARALAGAAIWVVWGYSQRRTENHTIAKGTESEDAMVERMYREGYSQSQIAATLGRQRKFVYRRIKRLEEAA